MRKVIVTEFLTLDGVMEAPEKWSFPYWNEEIAKFKFDELFASDFLLLGRLKTGRISTLRLVEAKTFSSGVVALSYQPAGKEEKK